MTQKTTGFLAAGAAVLLILFALINLSKCDDEPKEEKETFTTTITPIETYQQEEDGLLVYSAGITKMLATRNKRGKLQMLDLIPCKFYLYLDRTQLIETPLNEQEYKLTIPPPAFQMIVDIQMDSTKGYFTKIQERSLETLDEDWRPYILRSWQEYEEQPQERGIRIQKALLSYRQALASMRQEVINTAIDLGCMTQGKKVAERIITAEYERYGAKVYFDWVLIEN